MPTSIPDKTLDAILAIQFTVAWAGEGRCQPKRLGWWDTDLIDEAGGGDFFARLMPRTRHWAGLEAAREAARRTDAKARGKMANPDHMRSLFFLGFELDEQLSDRLAAHKRGGRAPADVLALSVPLDAQFAREHLATALVQSGDEATTVVPGGRQLKGSPPVDPAQLVRRLAAGLVPFPEQYPLPFFKVDR